ncbi:MAG TPA: nuclear transport factor 2 family protein [Kofleriaceae bacterium]|nr:nuclear transport factor 2 family protein [Kofleriaceae bacterium]
MGRLLVCALAAACLLACQHGAPAPAAPAAPATPVDVAAAGRATVESWRQAYEVRSFDALAKLYAQEPDLVLVQDGLPLIGWKTIGPLLQDRLTHAKDIHVRLKDVAVSALAPTAASVAATMTREIGDGVTTVTENGALTLVLRKDGDGWKIVAEHYSYKR